MAQHASSRNCSNIILTTWINSFWSIYLKSLRAMASGQTIIVNINHIYIGIFGSKLDNNSIPYRIDLKPSIFNVFPCKRNASWNINLYGPIFSLGYVYIIYFLNINGRGARRAQQKKYNCWRHIRYVTITAGGWMFAQKNSASVVCMLETVCDVFCGCQSPTNGS